MIPSTEPRMAGKEARPPTTAFAPSPQYVAQLVGITATYLAVAKLSLVLASIHPSATPIWPPSGVALATILLLGYRVWPAIFIAALITNVTTAGSLYTSLAIASGNTAE